MDTYDPVELAKELHLLGVSNAGVVELLSQYPHERIRKQLNYLPYRKAKRPEAIIMEAVRHNYSAPKTYFEHYYAKTESPHSQSNPLMDESAKHTLRQIDAESQGYRAPSFAPHDSSDEWLWQTGQGRDLALPEDFSEDRQIE